MAQTPQEQDKNPKTEENHHKKPKKRIIIPVAIVLLVGAAYISRNLYKYESTDDAYVETTTVDVAPKVSGEIINVYVEDNQVVKAGDLVAEIETNDYEIKLARQKRVMTGLF